LRCAQGKKPIISDVVFSIIKHAQELLSTPNNKNGLVVRPWGVLSTQLLRRGATIIRTQGRRFDLLAEAIASVEAQQFPLTPIVVVHGDDDIYSQVRQRCTATGSSTIVLHAGDVKRLRGFPCNIGLDYVKEHADKFGFVSFLDDDDIHYPDYAARLVAALNMTGADVVYAEANQREPWKEHTVGPRLMPAACLVAGNFIVMNSFALRVDALIRCDAFFRDDMEYLEDWHFLLSLLGAGARFTPLFETIAEYRIFSDGNTAKKRFPKIFSTCQKLCFDHGSLVARTLGMTFFYNSLTTFDFSARPALTPYEERQLLDTLNIFESSSSDTKREKGILYGS
jgi:glycosyltransferase involved in cell wall biosynthesis